MKRVRILIGVTCVFIAMSMAGLAVFGGFSMAGLATGLVLFCGLGGIWLICA